jgi:hypothetical protein
VALPPAVLKPNTCRPVDHLIGPDGGLLGSALLYDALHHVLRNRRSPRLTGGKLAKRRSISPHQLRPAPCRARRSRYLILGGVAEMAPRTGTTEQGNGHSTPYCQGVHAFYTPYICIRKRVKANIRHHKRVTPIQSVGTFLPTKPSTHSIVLPATGSVSRRLTSIQFWSLLLTQKRREYQPHTLSDAGPLGSYRKGDVPMAQKGRACKQASKRCGVEGQLVRASGAVSIHSSSFVLPSLIQKFTETPFHCGVAASNDPTLPNFCSVCLCDCPTFYSSEALVIHFITHGVPACRTGKESEPGDPCACPQKARVTS